MTTQTTTQQIIDNINDMNEAELIQLNNEYCEAIDDNDEKTQFEMLGMFLGAAFSGSYIAGLNTDGHNQ